MFVEDREIWKMNHDIAKLTNENSQLQQWVNDLQSGMYINCVYCGHRYGPKESTPTSMADILKEHIEQCPKHPASRLKKKNEMLCDGLAKALDIIHGELPPNDELLETLSKLLE